MHSGFTHESILTHNPEKQIQTMWISFKPTPWLSLALLSCAMASAEESVFAALTVELDVKYVDVGGQYPGVELWFPQLFSHNKTKETCKKMFKTWWFNLKN